MKFLARLGLRHGLAIVAGLLLALSFPKPDIAALAWLAPGLMLFAALGRRGKHSFWLGYLSGLTYYLCSLYWLLFIPFPAGAVVGWLALGAYLALYPAVWVWLGWKFLPGKKSPTGQTWRGAVREFFATHWWQRATWTMHCGALWVALEMIRARLLSGFPWNYLGVSQYHLLPLIQIASLTGVYGVSFLVAWGSVSLAAAFLRAFQRPFRPRCLLELQPVFIVLIGVVIFGIVRQRQPTATNRILVVALVQPSIPQQLIWDRSQDAGRFEKIMELSRRALAAKPDVLIWPESSLPGFTEDNFRAITNLIATHRIWMILGADDAERRPDATGQEDYSYFNAAFLLSPRGKYVATYRKQHLVAFGEYLPLATRLPILRELIPIPGDFTPGDELVPFELTEPRAKTSVLICFEDVFPGLARRSADDDTDFLLNLTNDGWFGESAAQWQQAANAVFRAAENGLPVVRCTNNGLTCWIDSHGRLMDILRSDSRGVYGPGVLFAKIPLLPDRRKREPTFYHRHGDWFGWGCLTLTVLTFTARLWTQRKRTLAGRVGVE